MAAKRRMRISVQSKRLLAYASAVLSGLALGGCFGPADMKVMESVKASEGAALAPQPVGSKSIAAGSLLNPDQKGLGALLLAEEMKANPEIAQAVGEFGTPDAVQCLRSSSPGQVYWAVERVGRR
jgi:hypothetical protein